VGAIFHIDNCPPEIRRTPVSSVQNQSHVFTRGRLGGGGGRMGEVAENLNGAGMSGVTCRELGLRATQYHRKVILA